MKYSVSKNIMMAASVGCVFVAAVMSSANAQDENDMMWQYGQYNDPQDKGRTVSVLQFGIPETDAVAVFGSCRAGSSGSFSKFTFGADVQGLALGQKVNVRFVTDRANTVLSGNVTPEYVEEGVHGLDFVIDNDDPLWDALKRGRYVSYSANGEPTRLSLRDSRGPIENFLADCRFYAKAEKVGVGDPDNEENRIPKSNDPRHATCNDPRLQKSDNSGQAVTVTFRNQTNAHRGVLWMDFEGRPIEYAALNPGESYKVNTNTSHPWMFTDGPGNCMEMYLPRIGESSFTITAPNP